MRLDPNYVLFDDNKHYVTRELALLEKERRSHRGRNNDDGVFHFGPKNDSSKPMNNEKEAKGTSSERIYILI